MNRHLDEYNRLFDDGKLSREKFTSLLELSPKTADGIALSCLVRYNQSRKRLQHVTSNLIRRSVEIILDEAQEGRFGAEYNFVQPLDPDQFWALKHTTTQLVFSWERGCMVQRMKSPFARLYDKYADVPVDNVEMEPIKLTLMAAASIYAIDGCIPTLTDSRRVKNIAAYGPRYCMDHSRTPSRHKKLHTPHNAPQEAPAPRIDHGEHSVHEPLSAAIQAGVPPWLLAERYGVSEKTILELPSRPLGTEQQG